MTTVVYFGCIDRPGHWYFTDRGRTKSLANPSPWVLVDGAIVPTDDRRQGSAVVERRRGWTALGCWDYTVDSRPGSVSVFLADADVTIDELFVLIDAQWPDVIERLEAAGGVRL